MRPMVLGHPISLVQMGPQTGPGILLVHGIGVSGRYFRALAHELSTTHRVVIPDLPGFGGSDRPRPALSIQQQARVMEELLALASLRDPVLVGHSMGSQVVTELAALRPELARALVLIGPVAEPPARGVLHQAWRLARDLPRESPAVVTTALRDYARGGPRSFAGSLPHLTSYPLQARLSTVTAPVVLVRGSRDPIASLAFLQTLAASTPRARVVEIPAAAHVAMAVRPDLVAAACRAP